MVKLVETVSITPAYQRDIPAIIQVDLDAASLFEDTGLLQPHALSDHVPREVLSEAIRDRRVDVARQAGEVTGFTMVTVRDKDLYLDQVSVAPEHGRKGIGRKLVTHVLDKAEESGFQNVTLSTFRDLPWNGPFYASLGFDILPRRKMAPYMLAIEDAQKPHMDVSKRVFMMKRLRRRLFRVKRPA